MKTKIKELLWIAVLSFAALHANAQISGDLFITATAEIQAGGYGAVTFPPKKFKLNTKQILAFLAQDEFASGNYSSTNFPPGARLVLGGDTQFDDNSLDFVVLDRDGNELVDVSDILKLTNGANVIVWGNLYESDGTKIRSHSSKYMEQFTYDSTDPSGLDLHFSITGSATCKVTQPKPDLSGAFTITSSLKMAGYGDGSFQGQPLAVTGDLSVTGQQKIQPPPPPPTGGGDGGDGGIGITINAGIIITKTVTQAHQS